MRTTYILRHNYNGVPQKRAYLVSVAHLTPGNSLYGEACVKVNGKPYFVTTRRYKFLWLFTVTQYVYAGHLYKSLKDLVKALTNTF